MSGEVLVDALPYIDTGYEEPGVREAALAMVEEETKEYRPTKNYLEHLPPLRLHDFETDILKGEFERMAARHPMDQLPMKRYELPHPPAGKMTDPAAWNECVDNSMAQLQHQFTRITNLDLMMEFSCEAWKSYCTTLTNMLAMAQRRLAAEKKSVQELNWQRKSTQTAAGDQIKKLEAEWVGLVSKNFEIELECLKLQRNIDKLKIEGAPPRPIKKKRSIEEQVPPIEQKRFRKVDDREKTPEYEEEPKKRHYAEESDDEDDEDLRKYDLMAGDEEPEYNVRRRKSDERDEENDDKQRERMEEGEDDKEDGREERQDVHEEREKRREEEWEKRRGDEREKRREEEREEREEESSDSEEERGDKQEGEGDDRREDGKEKVDKGKGRWDERGDGKEGEGEKRRRYSSSSSSGSSSGSSSESEEERRGEGGGGGGEEMDLENTDSD